MKGKIILLVASSMALGCVAFAADRIDHDVILVDVQKKEPLKLDVSTFVLKAADILAMEVADMLIVERYDHEAITVIYADVVLPGYSNPVLPVSHAPPKA